MAQPWEGEGLRGRPGGSRPFNPKAGQRKLDRWAGPPKPSARRLRAESTDVERKLWAMLRGRLGGLKFRRQVPIDRNFADFACVEAKLIVELDGGQHTDRAAYDEQRTKTLLARGWHVIRFWNSDVVDNADGVADTILSELGRRAP